MNSLPRRTLLKALSATAPARLLAKPGNTSHPQKMCVSAASCAYRIRYSRMKEVPAGIPPVKDPITLLEHFRQLGAGGGQVSTRDWTQDGMARKLRSYCEEHGLRLEGQISLPNNSLDAERFDHQVRAAKEAGAPILRTVCLSGRRYEIFKSLEHWKSFVATSYARVRRAEPILARHRMNLAIENHKDWRTQEFLQMMETFSQPHIGINLDTGNNISLLEDPVAVTEALAPFTLTTHLKDMGVQAYKDGFLLAEVPLGQGFLDLPRIVSTCRKARPDVQFNLEMITRDPLRIPCKTPSYWASFDKSKLAQDLATALASVQTHQHNTPLPTLAGKSPAERVANEEANNRACFAYAQQHLAL